MMREISSEDFGEAMKGLNDNSDKAEKSKLVNQTVAFGELFASKPSLKKRRYLESGLGARYRFAVFLEW